MSQTSDGRFVEQSSGLWLDKRSVRLVTKNHVLHYLKGHKLVSLVREVNDARSQ